jgi:hypothetical protein
MLKLIVEDKGDMSVGLFPQSWTIECPLTKDDDENIRAIFKEAIIEVYKDFVDKNITAIFEDEIDQMYLQLADGQE